MTAARIPPEGPTCEWKEILPRPERMAKTICAFGNSAGGELWIGIADDGRIVGLSWDNGLKEAFDEAAKLVDPTPKWRWEHVRREEKTLVRVRIRRLKEGVCALIQRDGRRTIYLREGATNRPASARTVRALLGEHTVKVGAKERELLRLLEKSNPQSLGELAKKLRMGERRTRQLLVPLLRAGLVHDREGRRYALTARGAERL